MRYTELSHQFANDSVATRRVAQIATFLHAGKITGRNFPSARTCKPAFACHPNCQFAFGALLAKFLL
jgi:hypothetical protein